MLTAIRAVKSHHKLESGHLKSHLDDGSYILSAVSCEHTFPMYVRLPQTPGMLEENVSLNKPKTPPVAPTPLGTQGHVPPLLKIAEHGGTIWRMQE